MFFVCLAMCETEEEKVKFRTIYEKYNGMINGMAMTIMNDRQDAEDAAQESLITITRYLDKISLKSRGRTKVFISLIVRHTCINLINKNARRLEAEEFDDENDEPFAIPIFEEPLEALTDQQGAELIKEKIKSLDEIYQSVVLLKAVYDYSDEKIARILGITANTVRVRMTRARKMLKQQLTKQKGAGCNYE